MDYCNPKPRLHTIHATFLTPKCDVIKGLKSQHCPPLFPEIDAHHHSLTNYIRKTEEACAYLRTKWLRNRNARTHFSLPRCQHRNWFKTDNVAYYLTVEPHKAIGATNQQDFRPTEKLCAWQLYRRKSYSFTSNSSKIIGKCASVSSLDVTRIIFKPPLLSGYDRRCRWR